MGVPRNRLQQPQPSSAEKSSSSYLTPSSTASASDSQRSTTISSSAENDELRVRLDEQRTLTRKNIDVLNDLVEKVTTSVGSDAITDLKASIDKLDETQKALSSEVAQLKSRVSQPMKLADSSQKAITAGLGAETSQQLSEAVDRGLKDSLAKERAEREDQMRSMRKLTERAEKAAQRMEALDHQIEEKMAETAAQRRTAAIWQLVRDGAAALLPIGLIVLAMSVVFTGLWKSLGMEPVLTWIWSGFEAAKAWWVKLIIAVGGMAFVVFFIGACAWVAAWASEKARRWG